MDSWTWLTWLELRASERASAISKPIRSTFIHDESGDKRIARNYDVARQERRKGEMRERKRLSDVVILNQVSVFFLQKMCWTHQGVRCNF